ncbi:MAG TPA: DUF2459 domain-containing protein [Tepidisphaeraceae bacterium]|jgi:hypothetical protein|nr:DUF2459 domain-containing protein [Tepidisphaeraceae bacterium]
MAKTLTVSLLVLLLSGCAATVYPQPTPLRPTAVYVADYGIHSSLLMPNYDGRYVEYAFGDWNFAAMNHCWPQDALGALLVSFQSALGRRYITPEPGQTLPKPTHPEPHQLQVIYASDADVRRVVLELDARFRRSGSPAVHNSENGFDYVKDTEHYWVANNCNHLTARCLREMGCDVRGLVVLSRFDVEAQHIPEPRREIQTARVASPATMPTATAN